LSGRTNSALTALGDTECHSAILNIAVEIAHINITLAYAVAQRTRQINSGSASVQQPPNSSAIVTSTNPKTAATNTTTTNTTTATNSNGTFTTLASSNTQQSMTVYTPTRFVY